MEPNYKLTSQEAYMRVFNAHVEKRGNFDVFGYLCDFAAQEGLPSCVPNFTARLPDYTTCLSEKESNAP